MIKILQKCLEILQNGEEIVMATILSCTGSTPRTTGAKMIIQKNESTFGTIGGGPVEGEATKIALQAFTSKNALIVSFNLNSKTISDGPVCGGQLTVLIELVKADAVTIELYQTFLSASKEGRECSMVMEIGIEDNNNLNDNTVECSTNRYLMEHNGTLLVGNRRFGESMTGTIHETLKSPNPSHITVDKNHQLLIEPSITVLTLYLFGAGHISLELAKIAKMVGFRVVVIDDRQEYANRNRFEKADEIKVISSFNDAYDDIVIDEKSYIVIITRGHLHDKAILTQALKTSAHYIGMIGSRRKRDTLYSALLKEGFTSEDLERVHCPIGLKIGADTPQEIAVSIVAEVISIRANSYKS